MVDGGVVLGCISVTEGKGDATQCAGRAMTPGMGDWEQLETGRGLGISVGGAGLLERWDATMENGRRTDMYPELAGGR